MKTEKHFRSQADNGRNTEDLIRKAAKLEPIRKSGKERHALYSELDDEDPELESYRAKESILDYFDDGEEE